VSTTRNEQKIKMRTKNKLISVIGPVQSHYHEGSTLSTIVTNESDQKQVLGTLPAAAGMK